MDSIPVQVRRRTRIHTMNTITEFGKYSISEVLNRKVSQQDMRAYSKYGRGMYKGTTKDSDWALT